MSSYNKTLDYLFGLRNSGIKLGLDRIERLMELLGHPFRAYPTVLIGGTNGKGSVSAILASILEQAGYRTGLYTSPHLVKFNERIRVGGELITDAELSLITEEIKGLVDERALDGEPDLSPSFFEFTTAIAFAFFRRKSVDIALLEVGMGGRLDATNVAEPELSVITGVGLDHMSSLGADIAIIAVEKAGIIKERRPVVTGLLEPEARRVIERIAKERSAPLIMAGESFSVDPCEAGEDGEGSENGQGGLFSFRSAVVSYDGLELALRGAHQQGNAGIAIAVLESLSESGFKVTPEELRAGLKGVRWPGRCEIVGREPTVMLDCAHNESAAEALKNVLKEFTYARLILVVGIMKDKDIGAILSLLAPLAGSIIFTRADMERAEEPEKLLSMLRESVSANVRAASIDSVDDALRSALSQAREDDLICVTGSIFVVGEARQSFKKISG